MLQCKNKGVTVMTLLAAVKFASIFIVNWIFLFIICCQKTLNKAAEG